MPKASLRLSSAEKAALLAKVAALEKSEGIPAYEAAKRVGVARSALYSWRYHANKRPGKRKKVARRVQSKSVTTVSKPPVTFQIHADDTELFIVRGKSQDVVRALALLTGR